MLRRFTIMKDEEFFELEKRNYNSKKNDPLSRLEAILEINRLCCLHFGISCFGYLVKCGIDERYLDTLYAEHYFGSKGNIKTRKSIYINWYKNIKYPGKTIEALRDKLQKEAAK